MAQLCDKYLEAARGGFVLTRFGKAKRHAQADQLQLNGYRKHRYDVLLLSEQCENF